jgi:hypothetical protein
LAAQPSPAVELQHIRFVSVENGAPSAVHSNGTGNGLERKPSSVDQPAGVNRERTQSDRKLSDRANSARGVNFTPDTVVEMRGGVSAPPMHRAKSVSHWHDSRISVEMHLALQIEDLMMMAPGVAGEQQQGEAAQEQPQNGAAKAMPVVTPSAEDAVPVEFDEDAEPDITLGHVLAGVEYRQ